MHKLEIEDGCIRGEHPIPAKIENLIGKLKREKSMNARKAARLLADTDLVVEDIATWANFDHAKEDSYGRKQVYCCDHFEMMVMSWDPGDFSAIHDHGQAQWGAVQIFGNAEHAVFKLQDDCLTTACRTRVSPGEVNPVSHDLIHQMGNPGDVPFLSFHLYGVYEPCQQITGDARIFDLFRGEIQIQTGGAFFCLPHDRFDRVEKGLSADFHTTARHHSEMLRRLDRMIAENPCSNNIQLQDEVQARLFNCESMECFQQDLQSLMDGEGHIKDRQKWRLFWSEVRHAARFKDRVASQTSLAASS